MFGVEGVDEVAEDGFGDLEADALAGVGEERQLLFGGVDVDHGGEVDDVFPAKAEEGMGIVDGKEGEALFDAGKSEGDHEVGA